MQGSLDLVDCWHHGGTASHQLLKVLDGVVGDAERADEACLLRLLELLVRLHVFAGDWPVDAVQVDVVGAEVGEGLLELRLDGLRTGMDRSGPALAGDEELGPWDAAIRNPLADRFLVRVKLCAVKEAVAELERSSYTVRRVDRVRLCLRARARTRSSDANSCSRCRMQRMRAMRRHARTEPAATADDADDGTTPTL